MPQLVRSTLNKAHKYGIRIIGILTILSMILAFFEGNSDYLSWGNIRLFFWFTVVFINYKLLEKINRRTSACIVMGACYLSFYIYPFLPFDLNHAENLFLLPSTLIIFSILAYLVFDIKTEKLWIGTWVGLLLVTFFVAIEHSIPLIDQEKYAGLIVVVKDYTMLAVAFFASWVFIQIIFYRYLKSINLQTDRISEVNNNLKNAVAQIDDQNNDLDEHSTELVKLQNEIAELNNSLENQVKERTAELERQNEILNRYGFLNSKLVRGPIEHILNNYDFEKSKDSLDVGFLSGVVKDLDAITVAISQVLNSKKLDAIQRVERMIKKKYSSNERL